MRWRGVALLWRHGPARCGRRRRNERADKRGALAKLTKPWEADWDKPECRCAELVVEGALHCNGAMEHHLTVLTSPTLGMQSECVHKALAGRTLALIAAMAATPPAGLATRNYRRASSTTHPKYSPTHYTPSPHPRNTLPPAAICCPARQPASSSSHFALLHTMQYPCAIRLPLPPPSQLPDLPPSVNRLAGCE